MRSILLSNGRKKNTVEHNKKQRRNASLNRKLLRKRSVAKSKKLKSWRVSVSKKETSSTSDHSPSGNT